MKYLKDGPGSDDADSAEDTIVSTVAMEQRLQAVQDKLRELPADSDPRERANLQLQVAGTLVDLDRATEAWEIARATFDELLELEDWEHAVLACDILFQADQEGSLAALGQGLWMAVTYPIDPELTVAMLEHVVEETPDDSDGAAVAAATACYITDLRAEGRKRVYDGRYRDAEIGPDCDLPFAVRLKVPEQLPWTRWEDLIAGASGEDPADLDDFDRADGFLKRRSRNQGRAGL